jgi:hypothetical protein
MDYVERRRVVWTICFLLALQRPLVYLLGLDQLALVLVKGCQVINRVERRRVVRTLCLLVAF